MSGFTPGHILGAVMIFLIRAYQMIHTSFFRGSCRFDPTCSQYTLEAIQIHGPLKGTYLGTRRILKCHPFHKGGFDSVPPKTHAH